jgi:hypothetical protein
MVVDFFKFCSPSTLIYLVRASIFVHMVDMLLESTLVGLDLIECQPIFS